MTPETNPQTPPKKSHTKKLLLLTLIIVLALVGKIVYDEIEKGKLHAENQARRTELKATRETLDSIREEVQAKITTIEELGGRVDTLLQIKNELQRERDLLEDRTLEEIQSLQEKVEGYTALLLQKDKEIVKLREVNELLSGENTQLKQKQNLLTKSITHLKTTQSKLKKKVTLASQLSITAPQVEGIDEKGKTLRRLSAQKIKTLKISFGIKANSIADSDGKEVLLRIIAPNSKVLFDINRGAGSFFFNQKELFYTLKQDILYDKRSQQVSFLYEKQSSYPRGLYQLEIYTEGYLMGRGSFELK